MYTYGKYEGNLLIVLRQNNAGYFIVDAYNKDRSRLRFFTSIKEKDFPIHLTKSNFCVENLIVALLNNVESGTFKTRWNPFSSKVTDVDGLAKMTIDNFKYNSMWR